MSIIAPASSRWSRGAKPQLGGSPTSRTSSSSGPGAARRVGQVGQRRERRAARPRRRRARCSSSFARAATSRIAGDLASRRPRRRLGGRARWRRSARRAAPPARAAARAGAHRGPERIDLRDNNYVIYGNWSCPHWPNSCENEDEWQCEYTRESFKRYLKLNSKGKHDFFMNSCKGCDKESCLEFLPIQGSTKVCICK